MLPQQRTTAIFVLMLMVSGLTFFYWQIGLAPVFIIGIPGIFTYAFWYMTFLKKPTDPAVILPPFLATVAGFTFHLIEEYLGHYAPAISRIFNFGWTERLFFVVICCLLGGLSLIAIGLYYQKVVAGFVGMLFISTRLAELSLFIFPFIKPQLQPQTASPISERISGSFVADMPNYYYYTTGHYYFPGMYTILFPLLPAVFTLYRIWTSYASRATKHF